MILTANIDSYAACIRFVLHEYGIVQMTLVRKKTVTLAQVLPSARVKSACGTTEKWFAIKAMTSYMSVYVTINLVFFLAS